MSQSENKIEAVSDDTHLLFQEISDIIQQARHQVRQAVNQAMVQCYWQVGRLIIEHKQQGSNRAAYGKKQLQILSRQLTDEFGKGFDVRNLRNMRAFYQCYPIRDAVRTELSWTHYRKLIHRFYITFQNGRQCLSFYPGNTKTLG